MAVSSRGTSSTAPGSACHSAAMAFPMLARVLAEATFGWPMRVLRVRGRRWDDPRLSLYEAWSHGSLSPTETALSLRLDGLPIGPATAATMIG